jgi:hypothetical protein
MLRRSGGREPLEWSGRKIEGVRHEGTRARQMGRHPHGDRCRATRSQSLHVPAIEPFDHLPEEEKKQVVRAAMMRRSLAEDASHDERSILVVRHDRGQ